MKIICPRCGYEANRRFYGPCWDCVDEMRWGWSLNWEPEDIEVPEYEPKMNVTPNAVALRDD